MNQRDLHYHPPSNMVPAYSNYFQAAVPPLTQSQIRLSPGKYSLGVDSTIPFVSLGGSQSQKIFTWGEVIEVTGTQQVTVKNESYMKGDIQINTGWDFAAKPERISVPVTVETVNFDTGEGIITSYASTFPADTRRCRRGYLACQFISGNTNAITITFTGKPQKHSYPGTDLITGQKTYTETVIIPVNTSGGVFPMGFASNDADPTFPHAFTDQVSFSFSPVDAEDISSFVNTLFFYILEY